MLKFLKKEADLTRTENGALTHSGTGSACLDLFASIGGLRSAAEAEILRRFHLAYSEDPDLAMKLLFFARDIRGGLGERRVFRIIWKDLASFAPESVRKNLPHLARFGRWDDLLVLLGTACEKDALTLIKQQLASDAMSMDMGDEVSLLAKWLPSVNASNVETVRMAKRIARALKLSDADYRRQLVKLRKYIRILENDLREGSYTFDYAKQPSKAMYKYRKAFARNDGERYSAYLDSVAKGEAALHTDTLTPYDIVQPLLRRDAADADRRSADVTWKALPDFTRGENALVVADGSGSMYAWEHARPAAVALSLAIYFAERNTGVFQNHFITFSKRPRLVEIKGHDIAEKVACCRRCNEIANTDLQKVFELILKTAVKHNLPQSQLPATLYIISDMEFDACAEGAELTNFEYAKKLYEKHGYSLPRVVFWNVASRNAQQPVTQNEQGVALVSGSSPRIFSMLSSGELSPMALMLDILESERYAVIAA